MLIQQRQASCPLLLGAALAEAESSPHPVTARTAERGLATKTTGTTPAGASTATMTATTA